MRAIDGVGSKLLGEWHEDSPRAYHVRRRLTPDEQKLVGDVLDLRGTAEARDRLARFLDAMVGDPALSMMRQMALEELSQ
jgi:hypothetical protein